MFIDKPTVESTDNRLNLWRLKGDLIWEAKDGPRIFIRKGFITDFASIPAKAKFIMAPMGSYSWACVLHDYLLGVGSRSHARHMFNVALKSEGVNAIQRFILMGAVRANDYKLSRR